MPAAQHLHHRLIVPDGEYSLQAITDGCDTASESNFSAALPMSTSRFADVVSNCSVIPCGPPNNVVEIVDVVAVLNKFKNANIAPTKARCDLEPGTLDNLINISDVTTALDGFAGGSYPFAPPASFPCGAGSAQGVSAE